MEYLFLWIICGLIAAAIYSQKGRSGFVGAVGGFLLGPLGIILALASSGDTRGVERRALKSGEMKRCPRCAEMVRTEAAVCRYCGQSFLTHAERVRGMLDASNPRPVARVCPKCGATVAVCQPFCSQCGEAP